MIRKEGILNKQQRIQLIKTISFWSYKREKVKGLHLLSDYDLFKIALKKFTKVTIRNIIKQEGTK